MGPQHDIPVFVITVYPAFNPAFTPGEGAAEGPARRPWGGQGGGANRGGAAKRIFIYDRFEKEDRVGNGEGGAHRSPATYRWARQQDFVPGEEPPCTFVLVGPDGPQR